MPQSVQDYVGQTLDDARVCPTHIKVLALIAAGYFFDVLDYVIFGSLIPDMLKQSFATSGQLALVGSAQLFGLAIGTFFQGQFTDRLGRKSVYQFNLLLFGVATILGALSPSVTWLIVFRFVAGLGLGAEQPLCFAYAGEFAPKRMRGRFLAIVHFIGGALVWPLAAIITLTLRDTIGWRGIWVAIGVGALIVFVLRFSLPESPRWLAARSKHERALAVLRRMGFPEPREELDTTAVASTEDPFVLVWRHYPTRLVAAMVCLSAFFCVTIGLGGWLPNLMGSRGFSITKSLGYTFGMTLAVPCASVFMMYALDKWGRKITATTAFVFSGLFAIAFANAATDTQILLAGFVMIFCYQVAGNGMQIFTSEVFPTSARASGFGMAAGVGRLATAAFFPVIPWIQNSFGFTAVFVTLAGLLLIAAVGTNLIGPETRQRALEDIAPSTGG